MTQTLDTQKITLGKAAVVGIFLGQAIITYMASSYGTASAIKELEYKTNMKIQEMEYEDKLIWNRINMVASNTYRHEAVKPEEIKPREYSPQK